MLTNPPLISVKWIYAGIVFAHLTTGTLPIVYAFHAITTVTK